LRVKIFPKLSQEFYRTFRPHWAYGSKRRDEAVSLPVRLSWDELAVYGTAAIISESILNGSKIFGGD
jgi:hypothetical protein